MTGDALGLGLDAEGQVVARKAAFGGSAEAVVRCRTSMHVVTVRPGVLPLLQPRARQSLESRELHGSVDGRFVVHERRRLDGGALLTAERVVGVGQGVAPDELGLLEPLLEVLGAEVAATRKVTDAGWLPRARQLGVTGHAIAPRLYVAVGISGKVTHTAGVRRAHTILAIDRNPDAAMLAGADLALVGDWRVVVPLLVAAIAGARHGYGPDLP